MTVIGLWLAIVGYGIAYSGMIQLGGGKCSLLDGFRGRCQPAAPRTTAAGAPTGVTLLAQRQGNQQQQAGLIGTQPIPQGQLA